jgi:hypothetical protein
MKGNEKMNAKYVNGDWKKIFGGACRNCYQKALAQINHARETILAEARKTLHIQEQLLRLALNEAEALAFQTLYPQLVFPTLAAEKIQRAAGWSHRQQSLA